jgi:membrane protease YdiL (CAAX protease family)
MLFAIALFISAVAIGDALGSAIASHSGAATMWVRNGILLSVVLLTYKLVISRLGASPRDDLRLNRSLLHLGFGLLVGGLLMAACVGAASIAHVYNLVGEGDPSQLTHELVTAAIMPAFMEEILFRGILFRWVEDLAGSWAALVITSVFFGMAHFFNPNATWFSSLAIAVEAGLLLGGAYMLTRSLWLPIGIHAAWNFTQGEIFGVPVSGGAVHGLLRSRLTGPTLLSGGSFGLEASLIALVIASLVGLCLVRLAVRNGQLMAPWWASRSGSPRGAD